MYKKVMLVLGLLIIVSLVVVGCGQNEQEANNNEPVGNNDDDGEEAPPEEVWEPYAGLTASAPGEVGGWLDQVSMSIVTSDTAVTQITAGAVDLYASNLSTPTEFTAIEEAGLLRSHQFGLYYEMTYNPAGPTFDATGALNPFSNTHIREATQWLYDRDYLDQEIYGGTATPKFFSLVSGFPDYARYVDTIRGLEAKYQYDFEKAEGIITAEMEKMGAVLNADGKWTHGGVGCVPEDYVNEVPGWDEEDVEFADAEEAEDAEATEEPADEEVVECGEAELVTLINLIRTDSDGTRVPIGDYVSDQLELVGFTVVRDYRTSSEASPLWVLGNMHDGLWNLYTGAWGSGSVSRDDGSDFQFFYTRQSGYAFSDLWQHYDITNDFYACSEALALNTFTTMEERKGLFETCLAETFAHSYRVWLIDGKGASTWKQGLEVAYDLSAGVDINRMWPYTLRYTDETGGVVNWGTPDLFVDPANPIAGSNWTYDSQWQIPSSDNDALANPHTGLAMPQRFASAEVYILEGKPVGQTLDWVTLEFVSEIAVPADAWIDWDPATETFIEAGEGVTAKRKVVYTYPDNTFDIVWHDGSSFSIADMVMLWIETFAIGTEGSPILDDSQVAPLDSFKSTFKGIKLVSEDPLVWEFYSDTYFLDAENNAFGAFWPQYAYGEAGWHMMAVANKAEAAEVLAFSADKSDALEVEWMNFIGGPSLEILKGYLDEALAETYIPFEATMGQFVSAEEAEVRYKNLNAWYGEHSHFWVGTGPYWLDEVYLVEKTATMIHNPYYVDPSDKWAGFSEPKLSEVLVDGPSSVVAGEEASFTVYVDYAGEPYPLNEVALIKYILFDATGEIVEVGEGVGVEDGLFTITLSAETTAALAAGAIKMEVAAVVIPVSIPTFSTFEFTIE